MFPSHKVFEDGFDPNTDNVDDRDSLGSPKENGGQIPNVVHRRTKRQARRSRSHRQGTPGDILYIPPAYMHVIYYERY